MSSKRDSLKKIAIGTATALSAPVVFAKRRSRMRLVMAIPKTLPVWGPAVEKFAQDVRKMSEGSLDIKVYGAGELVPALEVFNAVKAGRVQMGHSASYYWQGMMPASPFFTAVPFGLNANGMRAWIQFGGGQQLWDELYAPHNVKAFPAGNTGMQMGGWFNKEIKTIKDFKGLKMRIPGLGGKVIEKAGAKPVLVAGGEIYTNLSTGVIDATEWVGPLHDYTMGFPKAAKYYYYPGWHEPGPVLELLINKKIWSGLSGELQAIIHAASGSLDRDIYAEWLLKDAEYLEKIKSEGKVQIREFPEAVMKQLHKYAEEVKVEVSKTSTLAKKIYDSHEAFAKRYKQHQFVSELAYWDVIEDN